MFDPDHFRDRQRAATTDFNPPAPLDGLLPKPPANVGAPGTPPPCKACGAVWTTTKAGRWTINHDAALHEPREHVDATPLEAPRRVADD